MCNGDKEELSKRYSVYCNKTTLNTKNNWSGSYFAKLIRAKIKIKNEFICLHWKPVVLLRMQGNLTLGNTHMYNVHIKNYILDDLRKKLTS